MADVNELLQSGARAIEEKFFQEQNARLITQLREKENIIKMREELKKLSLIHDEATINLLLEKGVTPASFLAIGLVPLIHVAWADGTLEDKERAYIMDYARKNGVSGDSPSVNLLNSWLKTSQDVQSLFQLWAQLIPHFKNETPSGHYQEFQTSLLNHCRGIADASGGFLGIGKISAKENTAIEQIERVLKS